MVELVGLEIDLGAGAAPGVKPAHFSGGGGGDAVNVAVTCASALMETEQDPTPEHAPCQPEKVEPEAGTATSCTVAVASRVCWQSALQEKAGVEDCTWPLPTMWSVSVCRPPPPDPLPPLDVLPHPETTMPATASQTPARIAFPRANEAKLSTVHPAPHPDRCMWQAGARLSDVWLLSRQTGWRCLVRPAARHVVATWRVRSARRFRFNSPIPCAPLRRICSRALARSSSASPIPSRGSLRRALCGTKW